MHIKFIFHVLDHTIYRIWNFYRMCPCRKFFLYKSFASAVILVDKPVAVHLTAHTFCHRRVLQHQRVISLLDTDVRSVQCLSKIQCRRIQNHSLSILRL